MTTASSSVTFRQEEDVDRNLALLGYGLLFFAVFFAGVPALIAVAIAYARLRNTQCVVKSHFKFQTFVFWVGFALTLLAALSAVAALVVLVGEIVRGAVDGKWDSLDTVMFDQVHVGVVMVMFGVAGVLAALAGAWLMVTSAYGFILLASRRSIRQTAH